jgi:FkbM family methyltransferase
MIQSKQPPMEVITAYGGNFLIPAGDDCIGLLLKRSGQFETDDIKRVTQYLEATQSKPSRRKLFVDIGANIGTHSISALKEHGFERLLAVEPSQKNYQLLTANLCINSLTDRATCIQAAASEHDGVSTLFHNPSNCGDHRLESNPQALKGDGAEESEQVNTINLRSHLSKELSGLEPKDALCWIDTQGHEIPILRTLQPLLEQGLPTVMEFWPYGMEQQGGTFKQLATCLRNPLLQFAEITKDTIQPLSLEGIAQRWRDLRDGDTGTPEGASFSNLLIHTRADEESIHPEEQRRIAMTLRCLDSHSIPKVPEAGTVIGDEFGSYQVMHNGIKVIQSGYYGAWMCKLIQDLRGHHEPQEEKVFHEIAKIASQDGLMIELGCYWAYYSLWFLKDHPKRKAIGLEPDVTHMAIAQKNATLNKLEQQFSVLHGLSSQTSEASVVIETESGEHLTLRGYTLEDLLRLSKRPVVEIAHCDAQGAESHVIDQVIALGAQQRLRFCIISTHAYEITGDPLTHQTCLEKLRASGAHIIAEHDVHESVSGDGLIAASFADEDKDLKIELSCNRYSTSLFANPAIHLSHAIKELNAIKAAIGETIRQPNRSLPWPQRLKQKLENILPT